MGTRADFYIRKEKQMEWLGSIGWDGMEVDDAVMNATTEESFRLELKKMLDGRDDATYPEDGWPWPWEDSRTTDYSWIFENGKVMASNWGYPLYDPLVEQEESDDVNKMEDYFPNMKHIQKVNFGKGSGLIIISSKNSE